MLPQMKTMRMRHLQAIRPNAFAHVSAYAKSLCSFCHSLHEPLPPRPAYCHYSHQYDVEPVAQAKGYMRCEVIDENSLRSSFFLLVHNVYLDGNPICQVDASQNSRLTCLVPHWVQISLEHPIIQHCLGFTSLRIYNLHITTTTIASS